jgi:hypothetical protein
MTAPVGAVLFSLNMLVNTGEGRSYSGSEIMSWMRDSGFQSPRVQHPTPHRHVARNRRQTLKQRLSTTQLSRPLAVEWSPVFC